MDSKIIWIIVGAAAWWFITQMQKKAANGGSALIDDTQYLPDGRIDAGLDQGEEYGSVVPLPNPANFFDGTQYDQPEAINGYGRGGAEDWRNSDDPGVALCKKLYGYSGAPRADQLMRMRQGRR